VGIVVVALGDDLGGNLLTIQAIGAEMGECRIAAEHLAVMHAHDAAAERIVHAIFNPCKVRPAMKMSAKNLSICGIA
jgi:hypothetical protein